MNALDLVVTAALLLAWAIVLMPILGFMRLRRLERRLEKLQDLTYTFTDASSRLSQALEHTITDPQSGLVRSESSRRSLMHNARNQLDQGAPADRLTVKLGLRRDELSLMDIGRRAGTATASERESAAAG
jgi:HAMP domain-containing protein